MIRLMGKPPTIQYKGAQFLSNYYDKINNKVKKNEYGKIVDEADRILEIRHKAPISRAMPHV